MIHVLAAALSAWLVASDPAPGTVAPDSLKLAWAERFAQAGSFHVRHVQTRLRAAPFYTRHPSGYRQLIAHADDRFAPDPALAGALAEALRRSARSPGLVTACADSVNKDEIVIHLGEGKEELAAFFSPQGGTLDFTDKGGRHASDCPGDSASTLLALLAKALPDDRRLEEIIACVTPPRVDSLAGSHVEVLPEAVVKVPPDYPDIARTNNIQGVVQVMALVGVAGLVERTIVRDSVPELDEGAVRAVEQWQFKPASSDGRPIAVWVAIPVKFSLR